MTAKLSVSPDSRRVFLPETTSISFGRQMKRKRLNSEKKTRSKMAAAMPAGMRICRFERSGMGPLRRGADSVTARVGSTSEIVARSVVLGAGRGAARHLRDAVFHLDDEHVGLRRQLAFVRLRDQIDGLSPNGEAHAAARARARGKEQSPGTTDQLVLPDGAAARGPEPPHYRLRGGAGRAA